ncbi:uncharacterized protein AMSG_03763 [Thecamonas trahens ATCC 50062]|uniref:LysM domain-containing protein n=1 Tax=Thecamonas trahens ATCC 50062 TaxID=461836 RepID=A0A0L0D507_THETB|nr:hypothetical protein AMSG_03763 [Thecamonas trahens ATCC 50062]KNC47330.1 hypothetical protein AMSG_03763 [Thecamonas trahens ATCC 50062]|eukprot:XP_013759668.1 hypothetical protein AMSG_03763 [Thecamonas trahens ATCC 50062]
MELIGPAPPPHRQHSQANGDLGPAPAYTVATGRPVSPPPAYEAHPPPPLPAAVGEKGKEKAQAAMADRLERIHATLDAVRVDPLLPDALPRGRLSPRAEDAPGALLQAVPNNDAPRASQGRPAATMRVPVGIDDTFGGIALRFGLSRRELVALNPGLRASQLQARATVVVPYRELSSEDTSALAQAAAPARASKIDAAVASFVRATRASSEDAVAYLACADGDVAAAIAEFQADAAWEADHPLT